MIRDDGGSTDEMSRFIDLQAWMVDIADECFVDIADECLTFNLYLKGVKGYHKICLDLRRDWREMVLVLRWNEHIWRTWGWHERYEA